MAFMVTKGSFPELCEISSERINSLDIFFKFLGMFKFLGTMSPLLLKHSIAELLYKGRWGGLEVLHQPAPSNSTVRTISPHHQAALSVRIINQHQTTASSQRIEHEEREELYGRINMRRAVWWELYGDSYMGELYEKNLFRSSRTQR